MSKPLQKTKFQPKMSCLSGPDVGRHFYIKHEQFTIGRSLDNDIILKDHQCSRKHVAIKISGQQAIIKNISTQKGLKVDGVEVQRIEIANKALIEIGDTQLEFALTDFHESRQDLELVPAPALNAPLPPHPQAYHPQAQPTTRPNPGPNRPPQRPKVRAKAKTSSGGKSFYIIIGIVGLLAYWLFSDTSGSKKPIPQLTSEQEQLQVIEQLQKQHQVLTEARAKKGLGTTAKKEAQSLYQQCFREYQNGRYQRAIDYCTASLTVDPQHQLAQTYQKKSLVKLDEQIRFHMIRGQQYREQNKFDFCIASFKEALILIRDTSSINYRKALAMKEECELLREGN